MVAADARGTEAARAAVCFVGMCAMFVSRWLTSAYVFPLYDSFAPWLRDLAVVCSVAALAGIALVVTWRSGRLPAELFVYVAAAVSAVGLGLVVWGTGAGPDVAVYVGACVSDVGSGLVVLAVCIACLGVPSRWLAPCVAFSYLAAYLVRSMLAGLDQGAGLVAFGIALAVALLAAMLPVAREIESANAQTSPAEEAVTRPASYLPLTHRLFVALAVYEIIYGYATTVGAGVPSFGWPTVVVFVAVAAFSLVHRVVSDPDWLFALSVLAVIAGLLAFGVPEVASVGAVSSLEATSLASGSGMFQVLAFYILIALGQRNKAIGPVVLAWGSAVMSLGVVVGANLGKLVMGLAAGAISAQLAAAVAVFVLAASALVIQRTLSMRGTLEGIEDASVQIIPPQSSESAIEARCQAIGEASGLTSREMEVFVLLAHGRNSPAIQEKLGVSYNTARTHVRHIYEKCGFHTQQELIDAVERG